MQSVVGKGGLSLPFQKNGPTNSKFASWLHVYHLSKLFLEHWGFMATADLYCPKGNHWGINLIKQRQRNKYSLGSDKTTLFFWQWLLPSETKTDAFGWLLMLLKNSTSLSYSLGWFHWQAIKPWRTGEALDSGVPLSFQAFSTWWPPLTVQISVGHFIQEACSCPTFRGGLGILEGW